jgi:ubiquitin C-terminal hydrolase
MSENQPNSKPNICGLANLGNTCFMNTTLQCITSLIHLFPSKDTIQSDSLLYEWLSLAELMNSNSGVISPKRFFQVLHITARKKNRILFTGFAQNDLPEFILFLFEMFHESIQHKVDINIHGIEKNTTDILAKKTYEMIQKMYANEYSSIIRDFYGISVTSIHDPTSNSLLSQTPEPFFLLDLPITKNNATLQECLQTYTQNETLTKTNAWYNSETKLKQDAIKNVSFFSLPKILIISLKRFSNSMRKLNHHIQCPIDDLDMSSYVCGYEKNVHYKLFGVANHTGSVMGGHYFAYVRSENDE